MTTRRVAAIFAIGILSACDGAPVTPAGPLPADTPLSTPTVVRDPAAPIQTDSTLYTLIRETNGWRTAITFTFHNVTSDTVYFQNCNGQLAVNLEKRESNQWLSYWSAPLMACLSPPVVILPGASSLQTLNLFGAPPGNIYPQFRGAEVTGVYRLTWSNLVWHYTHPGGVPIPVEHRQSNLFVLRTQ